MKQSRRKELKTNELSAYLHQIQEVAVRNSNYIIGGVVVVVLILVIALTIQSRRHRAETARWAEYNQIRQDAMAEITPEILSRADRLANETAGDARLGPAARELHADLAYQKALDTSPVTSQQEYADLLNQASSSYQAIIDGYPNMPDYVARARLGLAATIESLHVIGKADLDAARKQYQQVVESGNAAYIDVAKTRLETLADRTKPLEIVATRPEEPTETAPADTAPGQAIQVQPVEPPDVQDVAPAEPAEETPEETPAEAEPTTQPADQPAETPANQQ